jgi:hypothetical protein
MRLPQSLSYTKKQMEAKRSIPGRFPYLQRVGPPQAGYSNSAPNQDRGFHIGIGGGASHSKMLCERLGGLDGLLGDEVDRT